MQFGHKRPGKTIFLFVCVVSLEREREREREREMGSIPEAIRPHVDCIPYPLQGHINPMLKLAKLLHHRTQMLAKTST